MVEIEHNKNKRGFSILQKYLKKDEQVLPVTPNVVTIERPKIIESYLRQEQFKDRHFQEKIEIQNELLEY